jgi:hypothetical protein
MLCGTTGAQNVAVGFNSLRLNNACYNTAVGVCAMAANTTGANNVAMGASALAANTTGANNVATGVSALAVNTFGSDNTAVGLQALCANTSACYNTAVGSSALSGTTIGNRNVAIGNSAGSIITTGGSNTIVGTFAQASSATVSNEVSIYNGSQTARFQGAPGLWSFVSDARDKTDVEPLPLGLEFVKELQPRKFKWDMRNSEVDKGRESAGFIAQEVLAVQEQFDADYTNIVRTDDPEQYTFAAAGLIPMMVNAIKELAAENADLKARIEALENA